MRRNVGELEDVARARGIDFEIYFARKANKCLNFVDNAINLGIGIDVASENELIQALGRGVSCEKLVCTAAVKSASLIDRCLQAGDAAGVLVVLDNRDELELISSRAIHFGTRAKVAIRLGGFMHEGEKLRTRFGFDAIEDSELIGELERALVDVAGIHFHLDGYDAGQRVSAISQSILWWDRLRSAGQPMQFIDMGGGFPMSYLDDFAQWDAFWMQLRLALLGERNPITYRNHGIGLIANAGKIVGKRNAYPSHQTPVRGDWLTGVLNASHADGTIASAISGRCIQLRCEPGRSLMDGCGITVARVEFRKKSQSGDWLIGLSMNGTQCRTSTADFLVDPLLVPLDRRKTGSPMTGYLVGAYCMEEELLSLRRLEFPQGVERGDLIVFPNTAGYQMHFMESRSHQFPLARNVFLDESNPSGVSLDPIDIDNNTDIDQGQGLRT
jgi:diaminopimelate decarboxylase